MATHEQARIKTRAMLLVFGAVMALALCLVLATCAQPAHAGSLKLDSSGTKATIAASTSLKYKASEMSNALWNHGTFYVYIFQGASAPVSTLVKNAYSDIKTNKTEVEFSDGVAWAKLHVAAVDSSTADNGGKNTRLKDSNKKTLTFGNYLKTAQKFYVWISDTGGDGGEISLRGTTSRTIYAGAKTFKNVEAVTVTSQPASDHYTQGANESDYNDVINVPLCWKGKESSQVPFRTVTEKGVGSSGLRITYYRLNWMQYSDGISYSGYSPYKLQHGVTSASNLWTSVNLGAIGITAVPSYTDETYTVKTNEVFRNYDTSLICLLKKPKEQIKLNTNGGVLKKAGVKYEGDSVKYKKVFCEKEVKLPAKGYKIGKDGTKKGYALESLTWKNGTNRSTFESTQPSSSADFISFDQASPEKLDPDSDTLKACNSWKLPKFSSDNLAGDNTVALKKPTVANVVYKAKWKPITFAIHYIVNGSEISSEQVDYDDPYKIGSAPSGSSGWTIMTKDGTDMPSSGYMPSQDIYAYADTTQDSTVRYFIDGELAATYTVPFGTTPLVTTYVNKNSGGIEYNNDGKWNIDTGTFTATYKEHYNIPDRIACTHWVDTSYYVSGYWVTSGYWRDEYGDGWATREWVDTSYYVSGYWVDDGYYRHSYDTKDNYSYYNTKTYTASYGAPSNMHGGTWYGWFSNKKCTSKASGTISFSQGGCLNLYSYTTHQVSYIINGGTVLTETYRYGANVAPYEHDDDLNTYGGELKHWFSDQGCSSKAPDSVTVGSSDIKFYGFTRHTIHFWMDAGTKVTSLSPDYVGGDSGGEADDGTVDEDADELAYCRYEITVKYGNVINMPIGSDVSEKVTRTGCEDWALNVGAWYTDAACAQKASNVICKGDATFYSYNVVKVTYGLTIFAQDLQDAHELYDKTTRAKTTLDSYLPAPKTYRYGTTIGVEGDGGVYWTTSAGLKRSAESRKGGYLDEDATGEPLKTITLPYSLTIYKDWSQGLFDGVITH